MRQKPKSLILNNILSEASQQLGALPSCEADGTPIEDSIHFDMYVDGIANIYFQDALGKKHYPFNKTIALVLVEDELHQRKNQPTEEDKK